MPTRKGGSKRRMTKRMRMRRRRGGAATSVDPPEILALDAAFNNLPDGDEKGTLKIAIELYKSSIKAKLNQVVEAPNAAAAV
jgi:hypothetical protein